MLRRAWQRWSLQARLLLSMLLILAATIAASGLLFYLSSTVTVEQQTFALTSNIVSQMTRGLDLYIENVRRLARNIHSDAIVQRVLRASDPTVGRQRQPDDDNDVSYRLLTLATSWPSVQGLYLYANDGALFYFTRGQRPRTGVAVGEEPWAPRMRHQAAPPLLLWPTAPESTVAGDGELVFSNISLVKNSATGRRLGFLKIDLDVAVMDELLALSAPAARGRQVLLLDDHGNVIYDSARALTGGQIDDLALGGVAPNQGRLEWRGTAYLYAAQRSAATGWTVWLLTPVALVTTEAQRTGLLVLALCAGAMLLLGAILYVVTKRTIRPLRVMAKTMERVEHGDLTVRVPPSSAPNELGRLSRVFNTMLDSIERLITQVYAAKLREKDAQIMALQSQINPHFLFNTLNSVRALSRRGDAAAVGAVTESLADLLRYSMSDWNELVPLREELGHVEDYVTIQRARFGERVGYSCAVPVGLEEALVVKLSLQPLVENAIAHGLGRCAGPLQIVVQATVDEEGLAVAVSDNGGGIELPRLMRIRAALERPIADDRLPTAEGGIGIANIDRRIKLLFGEQYGLRFRVIPQVGTTATLLLPFQCRDGEYELEAQGHEHSRGGG